MDIEIGKITVDVEIVGRADGLDSEIVQTYADRMEAGDVFPPIKLVGDGDVFWLVDGQHRLEAAKRVNGDQISAKVTKGDRWVALEMSGDNNADNGRPRTNEDKRQKVLMFLEGERWKDWSSRKIASQCKVSHTFVDKLRNHTGNVASMETERTFIHHKTGQPTTMNTANIGNADGNLVQTEIEPIISAEAVYEEKVKLKRKEKKIQQIKEEHSKSPLKSLFAEYASLLTKANVISKRMAVNYDEYEIRSEIESDSFLRNGISKAIAVNNDFVEGVKNGFQSKSN